MRNIKIQVVREETPKSPSIKGSKDVYNSMHKEASTLDREHFWVLCLNAKNRVLGKNLVSIGSVTETIVHPREVFKTAILLNSVSIILLHNHPSGETEPSREDVSITNRLKEAGELLGINVLDHIVLGDTGYYSFLEEGAL